ncbi:50S ribosomal protein L11 [Candidatus Dojkabacteria bacterium]|uniref:Large ribosomal subunit protein uL11 n=1 Tax=Candidatus Dojkabacteria bacterium TaxID=2099670 RepID=A0A955LB21_9BACT|nr:50S ribosomal protein L11 [Candidatus Dojkabacteria bacterium]
MAAPKKEVIGKVKLVIQAGKASPAPPLGPILGQNGIPIPDFCNEFNGKTQQMGNVEVPVNVTIFKDRSFRMEIKQPTVTSLLKSKLGIQKGSATPNKVIVKKVKKADLKEIAEKKLPDFNTNNVDSAINIVAGVAKSMGIEVTD